MDPQPRRSVTRLASDMALCMCLADGQVCMMQAVRVGCPVACQAACLAVCLTWVEQAHQQVAPRAALALKLRRSTKLVTPINA